MNKKSQTGARTAERKDGLDLPDGSRIEYRGWIIIRFENDFEHGFTVMDNNGWARVSDYPTLRRAKNCVDAILRTNKAA